MTSELMRCQCDNPWMLGDCHANATAEDLLCDYCRMFCRIQDHSAERTPAELTRMGLVYIRRNYFKLGSQYHRGLGPRQLIRN